MGRYHSKTSLLEINAPCFRDEGGGREKRNMADAGTKQVIYIAFGGKSACNVQ
jgi:hypothetical protein